MARPARDYEGLYQEWKATDLPRSEFLRCKGVNPASGSAYNHTRAWDARRHRETMPEDPIPAASIAAEPTAKEKGMAGLASIPRDIPATAATEIASEIENHIRLLLVGSRSHGAEGEKTTLTAYEVVKLTEALRDLQVIRGARNTEGPRTFPDGVSDNGPHNQSCAISPKPKLAYSNPTTKDGRFLYPRPRLLATAATNVAPSGIPAANSSESQIGLPILRAEVWDAKLSQYTQLKPRSSG